MKNKKNSITEISVFIIHLANIYPCVRSCQIAIEIKIIFIELTKNYHEIIMND